MFALRLPNLSSRILEFYEVHTVQGSGGFGVGLGLVWVLGMSLGSVILPVPVRYCILKLRAVLSVKGTETAIYPLRIVITRLKAWGTSSRANKYSGESSSTTTTLQINKSRHQSIVRCSSSHRIFFIK